MPRLNRVLLVVLTVLWASFSSSAMAQLPKYLFGTPRPLEGVTTPDMGEGSNAITPDELEIYFTRILNPVNNESGNFDIFVSRRGSKTEPFGLPEPESQLNSDPAFEGQPDISPDGLTLYYARSDESSPTKQLEIWSASRTSRHENFGPGRRILSAGSGFSYTTPSVTPDGLTMYLGRYDEPDNNDSDIYISRRSSVTHGR